MFIHCCHFISVSYKLDPLLSLMSLSKPSILSSVRELSNYAREKLDLESHTRLSAVRNTQSRSEASIMDIKDSTSSKGKHQTIHPQFNRIYIYPPRTKFLGLRSLVEFRSLKEMTMQRGMVRTKPGKTNESYQLIKLFLARSCASSQRKGKENFKEFGGLQVGR